MLSSEVVSSTMPPGSYRYQTGVASGGPSDRSTARIPMWTPARKASRSSLLMLSVPIAQSCQAPGPPARWLGVPAGGGNSTVEVR